MQIQSISVRFSSGGASKVWKGFQLEQMQVINSVEVIDMAYSYLMGPICPTYRGATDRYNTHCRKGLGILSVTYEI